MANADTRRPPIFYRAVLRMAGWMGTRQSRTAHQARWQTELRGLWTLIGRGELPGSGPNASASLCRASFAAAWKTRSRFEFDLRQFARGPAFLALALLSLALLSAWATHGFATTRTLISVLTGAVPLGARRLLGVRPENALVAHLVPLLFALVSAIMLVTTRCPSLRGLTLRGGTLLAGKLAILGGLTLLLWIEGGAALRTSSAPATLRLLVGGPLLALGFVVVFARTVRWCFDDQHRRCPVCLQRLVMPVSIGNWAGTFEPATTELVCASGHGSLAESETELGPPDRWSSFDPSWEALFETKA